MAASVLSKGVRTGRLAGQRQSRPQRKAGRQLLVECQPPRRSWSRQSMRSHASACRLVGEEVRQPLQGVRHCTARFGIGYQWDLWVSRAIVNHSRLVADSQGFARGAERRHQSRLANHGPAIDHDQLYRRLSCCNKACINISIGRRINDEQICALARLERTDEPVPFDDRCRNTCRHRNQLAIAQAESTNIVHSLCDLQLVQ